MIITSFLLHHPWFVRALCSVILFIYSALTLVLVTQQYGIYLLAALLHDLLSFMWTAISHSHACIHELNWYCVVIDTLQPASSLYELKIKWSWRCSQYICCQKHHCMWTGEYRASWMSSGLIIIAALHPVHMRSVQDYKILVDSLKLMVCPP